MDGAIWTTMVDPYLSDGGLDRVNVGQRTARYVKMEVISRFNANWGSSLWEFNVSDGRTATASSGLPSAAIDCDPNTRWSSDANDAQWITVDWGREKAFDTVRLLWEAAFGKVYELQTSTDNVHWKMVYRENNGDGNVDEVNVGDQRARYLRVYGIQRGTQWGYSLWEIDAFRSNDRNAALKMNTTASSGQASTAYAVDGSTGTGWISMADDNQWWQSDLGDVRWINRVVLKWGNVWARAYQLQASMDGLKWKTVYQTSTGDGGEDKALFSSIQARYVRMMGIKRSGVGGYDLREFEVNGPVIKAWASTEGSSMPAAYAVDGNSRTRWSGQATDPQWLVVDFGESRAFDRVHIVWETAYAKSYLLETSTDNVHWNIVATTTNSDGGTDDFIVGAQTARYLKIYCMSRGTLWGYSIYEVDAFTHNARDADALVGNLAEGPAPAGMEALTDVSAIQGAIQSNKGKILKDANGNMVIAGDKWIAYDYDNRPQKVVTEDGTMTTFTYDHEGQRVQQKVYAPSSSTPLVSTYIGTIYEAKGSERIKYIYAGSQRVAQVSSINGTSYFHTDHLGSASLMTNTLGTLTRSWGYLPFGGTFKTEGTGKADWRYTGQRQDDSTGLYFYNARYYDPVLGRFVSPDPLVSNSFYPQSLNRYAYCNNNPINFIDPSGFWRIGISYHFIVGGHMSYDSDNGHLKTGVGVGMGGGVSFGDNNWDIGASNANYLDVGYDNKMKSGYVQGQYGWGVRSPVGASHGYGMSGTYYFRQGEYVVGGGIGWYGLNANVGYSSFGDGDWSYGGGFAQFNATYNEASKDWSYYYTIDTKAWKDKYRNEQVRSEQNGGNGYGPVMENPIARAFFRGLDWIATVTAGRTPADMHDNGYANGDNKAKTDFALMTNMAIGATSAFLSQNGLFNTTVGLALSPIYYGGVAVGGGPAYRASNTK